jgi:RND family efflux transporter MFP subunit
MNSSGAKTVETTNKGTSNHWLLRLRRLVFRKWCGNPLTRPASRPRPDGVSGDTLSPKRVRAVVLISRKGIFATAATTGLLLASLMFLPSCGRVRAKDGGQQTAMVGVVKVTRKSLQRQITLSSELVPFQEIDVYAKESGYVQKLLVDYGTRVKQGQLMAVLEIPELVDLVQQDEAAVKSAQNLIDHAVHELKRFEAQYKVAHLESDRLTTVAEQRPGLVAQQDVDDAQGKDLAADSQVEAGKAALDAAKNQLSVAQAKLAHDRTIYDYSRITAPFAGVVTERYANLGTLMQAGTSSSTQVLPLVRLSQDHLFRLVIPVPESEVRYIRIGDPVDVRVPALNRTLPGKVARFSVDVREDTRTMHTEVDVPNPDRILLPGLYAEATITLQKADGVLALPLDAVAVRGPKASVCVVNSAGEIDVRPVNLGLRTPNEVEIMAGLQEDEEVVISDRSSLKAGQKVEARVMEPVEYQGQE